MTDLVAKALINIFLFDFLLMTGTHEKRMMNFEVSPDGKFLAFQGSYGFIYLLSAKVIAYLLLIVDHICIHKLDRFGSDGQ